MTNLQRGRIGPVMSGEDRLALALTAAGAAAIVLLHVLTYTLQLPW